MPQYNDGIDYVFVLLEIPGRKELLLPVGFDYSRMASLEYVEQLQMLLKARDWAWGKADESGLQLALVLNQAQITLRQSPRFGRYAQINVAVVLRNTGEKPILVDLHPERKPIRIGAMDNEGKVVETSPYEGCAASYLERTPWPTQIRHELRPGEMAVLSASGLARHGVNIQLEGVEKGTWSLYAVFEGKKSADGLVWTGRIQSEAAKASVAAPPNRE